MNFEQWLKQVDKILISRVFMSHEDLADQTWRDWYDSGMDAEEAAELCLDNQ